MPINKKNKKKTKKNKPGALGKITEGDYQGSLPFVEEKIHVHLEKQLLPSLDSMSASKVKKKT